MNKAVDDKNQEEWINWLKWFKKHRYELSKEESLALRDAIIAFYRVAVEFFYNTLEPMNSGLAYKIQNTYNITVSVTDIATSVYREMYSEGKWTRLKTFAGNCSLFSWISIAASQAVFKELRDLHYIPTSIELNHKNTSLTLRSMKHKDEVEMVVSLVEHSTMNDILTSLYVERLSEESTMKKLGMSEILFTETRKVAEMILKENLIQENMILWERENGEVVNLVQLALSDITNSINTSNSEEALLMAINKFSDEDEYPEVKDALEEYYPGRPWREQWYMFIMERTLEMGWSDEDMTVFIERFCNKSDPLDLAKRLGRARTWVDNKYSRELRALGKHIQKWWTFQFNINNRIYK